MLTLIGILQAYHIVPQLCLAGSVSFFIDLIASRNTVPTRSVLAHVLQPKVADPKPPAMDARDREQSSRLSALSHFSIGDMFRDVAGGGSKSTKFPEKLVKVVEQKLQDIAMGKDAMSVIPPTSLSLLILRRRYSDQLVRRTMAKFYGQFMVDSFKRQMKENRKIEELILMFATHATSVLKKEPTLAGDGWKLELNNQIAQFIRLLRECLRSLSHVSPELLSRLDTYTAKLAPTLTMTSRPVGSAHSDSGYDSASTRGERDSLSVASQPSHDVASMTLVKTLVTLFKIPEGAIQLEVDKIRGMATEKVGFNLQSHSNISLKTTHRLRLQTSRYVSDIKSSA